MEYIFTLKYRILEEDLDALVERLGEVGCDDALVGTGQPGRLALEFTRSGESAAGAMHSALVAVKKALPMARLIEVAPDFVGLSDVAAMVGVSRQNMRKLMLTHPRSFPAPVHESSVSIWHLVDLLAWLEGRGYAVDPVVLEVASAACEVNVAKEAGRIAGSVVRELSLLVA